MQKPAKWLGRLPFPFIPPGQRIAVVWPISECNINADSGKREPRMQGL